MALILFQLCVSGGGFPEKALDSGHLCAQRIKTVKSYAGVMNAFVMLIGDIKELIRRARHNAVYAVNAEMLKAYFEIGRRIVEE